MVALYPADTSADKVTRAQTRWKATKVIWVFSNKNGFTGFRWFCRLSPIWFGPDSLIAVLRCCGIYNIYSSWIGSGVAIPSILEGYALAQWLVATRLKLHLFFFIMRVLDKTSSCPQCHMFSVSSVLECKQ